MSLSFKFQLLEFTSSRKLGYEVRTEMGSSVVAGWVKRENLPYFLLINNKDGPSGR